MSPLEINDMPRNPRVPRDQMVIFDETNEHWVTVPRASQVVVKVLRITPKFASRLLDNNEKNRPISKTTVRKYVTDIMNGDWHVTNIGIGIYYDGVIADGQHRLQAVIDSNTPIVSLVVFNMDIPSGIAIDDGKKRSTKDRANLLHREEPPKFALEVLNYTLSAHGVQGKISSTQELAFFEKHKENLEAIAKINATYPKQKGVSVSYVAACAFVAMNSETNRIGTNVAFRFLHVLFGDMPKTEDEKVIWRLREWLIGHSTSEKGVSRKMAYLLTQRVLNYYIKGTNPKNGFRIDKDENGILDMKTYFRISQENLPSTVSLSV